MASTGSAKYRPEIDGLRAIAVLPVILYHADISLFSGGYIGVDVFFVISGFLITSIIYREIEGGTFSIAAFYERRIRRIFPALFFMMLCCIPFAWMWMIPDQLRAFGVSVASVVLFVSNFLFWKEDNYFDQVSDEKPLLHTWSLAVEEQYYAVFPILLFFLFRYWRKRLVPAIFVLALISFLLAEWGWRNAPSGNFYLAPTRFWELLAGSLGALITAHRNVVPNNVLATCGLAMIVIPMFLYSDATPFPSFYALAPVLGTVAVVLFSTSTAGVGRLLSTMPFVFIGLISYSAYLWHQPIFAFARLSSVESPSQPWMLFLAFISLIAAYLSWRFIESPFRNRARIAVRPIVWTAVVSTLLFVSAGAFVSRTHAWERWWINSRTPAEQEAYALMKKADREDNFAKNAQGVQDDGQCRFNALQIDKAVSGRLEKCRAQFGPGIMILGDSHAIDLFGLYVSQTPSRFVIGVTQGGCRPHDHLASCHYAGVLRYVRENPGTFRQIIFEQAGFYLLSTDRGSSVREVLQGTALTQNIDFLAINRANIGATLSYLADLGQHAPVIWFGPRFEPQIGLRAIMHYGCDYPYRPRPGQREIFDRLDRAIASDVGKVRNVKYVSQMEVMNFRFPQDFMTCHTSYWTDGDHFSAEGEKYFGSRLNRGSGAGLFAQ